MTAMAAELARVEDKYAALQKEVPSVVHSGVRSDLEMFVFFFVSALHFFCIVTIVFLPTIDGPIRGIS